MKRVAILAVLSAVLLGANEQTASTKLAMREPMVYDWSIVDAPPLGVLVRQSGVLTIMRNGRTATIDFTTSSGREARFLAHVSDDGQLTPLGNADINLAFVQRILLSGYNLATSITKGAPDKAGGGASWTAESHPVGSSRSALRLKVVVPREHGDYLDVSAEGRAALRVPYEGVVTTTTSAVRVRAVFVQHYLLAIAGSEDDIFDSIPGFASWSLVARGTNASIINDLQTKP